jgi:uncharacterized protein with HEPN domain
MREPLKDRERLEHILSAINRVLRYTKDKTYNELIANDMMYYAVVKNIEIMGEAANMLTFEFREAHPEIQWKQITNMRNFLIHGYHNVEEDLVWEAISVDLSPIREQIVKYLDEI